MFEKRTAAQKCLTKETDDGQKNADLELLQKEIEFHGKSGDYGKVGECLGYLRESYRSDHDKKAYWARGLVNAFIEYKKGKNIEGMEYCIKELDDLFAAYPEQYIGCYLYQRIYEIIKVYGASQSFEKMDFYIGRLKQLYTESGNEEILEVYTRVLVYAIRYSGIRREASRIELYMQSLRELCGNEASPRIKTHLAQGLIAIAGIYQSMGDIGRMDRCYEELRPLFKDCPGKVSLRIIADGLAFAVRSYGLAHDLDKLEKALEELRALYGQFPDSTMGAILAKGIYYAAVQYLSGGDFEKAERLQSELSELFRTCQIAGKEVKYAEKLSNVIKYCCPSKKKGECKTIVEDAEAKRDRDRFRETAVCLYDAIVQHADSKEFGDMEAALRELEALQATITDSSVRKKFAFGLSVALSAYGKTGDVEKTEYYFKRMEGLYDAWPASDIAVQLGFCLSCAAMTYRTAHDYGRMEEALIRLKKLYAIRPQGRTGRHLAHALSGAATGYGIAGEFGHAENTIGELRILAGASGQYWWTENLAVALSRVAVRYGMAGNASKMNELWSELKGLYDACPGDIITRELCTGWSRKMGLTIKYGDIDDMESLVREIEDSYGVYHSGEIAIALARCRYLALVRYGRFNRPDYIDKHIEGLRALAAIRTDLKIKKYLTLGLSYAAVSCYKADEKNKGDSYLLEIFRLYKTCLDEEVAYYISNTIIHALIRYGKEDNIEMMAECIDKLKELHAMYPDVRASERLLFALSYMSAAYGRSGDVNGMSDCISEAEELYGSFPMPGMAEELGKGLAYAITSYKGVEDVDKIGVCLTKLRKVYQSNSNIEIATIFSYGLCRALIFYGKSDRWQLMCDCLIELKGLNETYHIKAIREYYSRGLSNAGIFYGKAGWYDNMAECVSALKKFYAEYSEALIGQELAICLFNLQTICLRSWREYFSNLVLLYKLRFDLPGASRQEKILWVEALLAEETAKALAKRNKTYTREDLVQNIKELTGNDLDVGPLAEAVSRKLSYEAFY